MLARSSNLLAALSTEKMATLSRQEQNWATLRISSGGVSRVSATGSRGSGVDDAAAPMFVLSTGCGKTLKELRHQQNKAGLIINLLELTKRVSTF